RRRRHSRCRVAMGAPPVRRDPSQPRHTGSARPARDPHEDDAVGPGGGVSVQDRPEGRGCELEEGEVGTEVCRRGAQRGQPGGIGGGGPDQNVDGGRGGGGHQTSWEGPSHTTWGRRNRGWELTVPATPYTSRRSVAFRVVVTGPSA